MIGYYIIGPRPSRPVRLFPRALSRIFLAIVLAVLLAPRSSGAQEKPTLTWTGEVRPRLFAREPVGGGWDHWISMRTRLAVDARFQEGVGLFLQLQDVRFWGEETSNRDGSADAVDFHQAYLEVEDIPALGGFVRAGRQEVSLGDGGMRNTSQKSSAPQDRRR